MLMEENYWMVLHQRLLLDSCVLLISNKLGSGELAVEDNQV